jgi:23S rRNA pseudouridine1911/1915/1917 synthase
MLDTTIEPEQASLQQEDLSIQPLATLCLEEDMLAEEEEEEEAPETALEGDLPFSLEVDSLNVGERLDKFLADALPKAGSRQRWQQLLEAGVVSVRKPTQSESKVLEKASYKVRLGEVLTGVIPAQQALQFEAEDLPLTVIYEDEHLLVLNKAVGMLTHPTGRTTTGTLVNALLHHCKGQLSGINGVIRPGIVHRLDKDTQGLLVVAKTDVAHRHLSEQLKEKTMRRSYYAIVQGLPRTEGMVDLPIGRHPIHRQKMCIDRRHGRWAKTHWKVLETLGERFSCLEVELYTGRTHQIRVHMSHLGFPLVGDPLYGTSLSDLWQLNVKGQLLQAFRLQLEHPVTGEQLTFELPKADDLIRGWEGLAKHLAG